MAGENDPKGVGRPVGKPAPRKPGGRNDPSKQRAKADASASMVPTPRPIGPARPRSPGGKARPHVGYKQSDISYACEDCGRIYEGPHTGERVPLNRPANPDTRYVMHKGHPVSHGGGCTDPSCQGRREAVYREQLRQRYPNMGRLGDE